MILFFFLANITITKIASIDTLYCTPDRSCLLLLAARFAGIIPLEELECRDWLPALEAFQRAGASQPGSTPETKRIAEGLVVRGGHLLYFRYCATRFYEKVRPHRSSTPIPHPRPETLTSDRHAPTQNRQNLQKKCGSIEYCYCILVALLSTFWHCMPDSLEESSSGTRGYVLTTLLADTYQRSHWPLHL